MNWFAENWYIYVAAVAALIFAISWVVWFAKQPNEHKKNTVRTWLEWAVTEAEKALGSKTGQLKLRMVYDMALTKFPWLSSVVSFDEFSLWVDDALLWMRDQEKKNNAVADYISN